MHGTDTHGSGTDLGALVTELLGTAGTAGSGRAAATVHGGHEATLRQTVIALRAGAELAEHENPGEATLLVLTGRVRLTAASGAVEAGEGVLVVVPGERHGLTALADAAVLLTVAKLAG
ncbi:LuxR family transcriptional regulator [uncultured Modestobacter sp.]|uniref:LuxR family transcriptional regulator n=1 Tax=uncultured Modestobacter sp. TaxID=380048 RepID=UPI00262AB94D|nr:LuxR family transcriptional regulator [uncultured Modestobacter sp.]